MKVLILTDDMYGQLEAALDYTLTGKAVLASFNNPPKLPSDRELIAMARRGDDAPEAIARARAYRDAGRQAATDTREALERLIVHCHGAGVRPVDLERWFGLPRSRVYEVLGQSK